MTDFIEDYKSRVRKRLSRSESEPIVRMAEVLCFPSFHAETLLRVTERPDGTTFCLFTFSSSLWYSKENQPTRHQESILIPGVQAEQFWTSIEELKPTEIESENPLGLDGMSVIASYRRGGEAATFEMWSPDPDSIPGEFIGLIHRLGWKAVKNNVSIERLEQLHCYLGLGTPIRTIEGEVKCLRVFGRLSSADESSLQEVFDSFRETDPLVIDMTNFDGMGTLLYPTFLDFALKRPFLAWAATGNARQQVEAMGLNQPQIFDEVVDAIEWVVRRMQSR